MIKETEEGLVIAMRGLRWQWACGSVFKVGSRILGMRLFKLTNYVEAGYQFLSEMLILEGLTKPWERYSAQCLMMVDDTVCLTIKINPS